MSEAPASADRIPVRSSHSRIIVIALAGNLVAFGAIVLSIAFRSMDYTWWLVRLPGVLALVLTAAAISIQPSSTTRHRHHWLGWLAVGAVTLHVVFATGLHTKFWDWLAPYVPLEIAFGIVAAPCLLATLVLQRSKRLRLRFSPVSMLRLHRPVGYVALGAAATHVALIAGTPMHIVLLVVAGGMALVISAFCTSAMHIDRMFHAFCGECHRRESRIGEGKSGPIDDCSGCHTK